MLGADERDGRRRRLRRRPVRRALLALLGAAAAAGVLALAPGAAAAQEDDEPSARMARPTWDTGWFQAQVYRLLLERLGYRVEGPVTMGNAEFYEAVAAGEVDFWASGWFPLHYPLIDEEHPVEIVGTQVDDGALQGYFVDTATAEAHGITNLGDLADPDLAALFDHDGDGLGDLVGCDVGWSCALTIDHHLRAYGLSETVEHIQGEYSPLISATIDRYRAGQSVLYYTWTPNWTVGQMVPGRDAVWLEVPFPSLPADQASSLDRTAISQIAGCANDPCLTGWPPNDIRVVANSDFLDANPAVRTLLEQVVIPLKDISDQNVDMVLHGSDPQDIEDHAAAWIEANLAEVTRWIESADPDAVAVGESDGSDGQAAPSTLTVVARALPPFVLYENHAYSGFDVELARLLGASLGMEVEIRSVDTVAKQIDDIIRGVADVGLGGVAITESREEIIDFSLPVLDSGLTILTTTQSSRGIGHRIAAFYDAVASSDLPWLLIVFGVAVLISAHLIWWLERHSNPDFAVPYRRGIWDSFYWSVVTMSTVGYGDKVARGTRGRVLALIWIALGTLVFASFTAAIASSLAVNELRSDISGPADLRGRRVATVTHSAGSTYLHSIGLGAVQADNIQGAYQLLSAGEVEAVVFDAPVLQYHASREGAADVITVEGVFDRVDYGLMIHEDDDELREQLNLALLDLLESGVYGRLHEAWFGGEG